MRKLFGVGLLAVAGIFAANPGQAAITGTPHEVPSLATQGACSACHIPHKAAGKRLWPSNMAAGETLERGEVGSLCGYCHDPDSGVVPSAKTFFPFKDKPPIGALTHGIDKTIAPDGEADLDQTLPYIATAAMQCTSCHNVHDNTNVPFLQRDIDVLCASCHPYRQFVGGVEQATPAGAWGAYYGSTTNADHANGNPGSHPVGTDVWTDSSTHQYGGASTNDSPINIAQINVFQYDASGATRWSLGPHTINGAAALAAGTGMGCVTCHMVHGRDSQDHLTQASPVEDLLVVNQGSAGGHGNGEGMANNALCELCHRGTAVAPGYAAGAGIFANPGATSYTHPVDDYYPGADANVTAIPAGWPLGVGGVLDPAIICESCHIPHPLAAMDGDNNQTDPVVATNTHILRNADLDICADCHTAAVPDHHPIGAGLMDGTLFDDDVIGDADNDMECSDCHNGAGAHNWSSVGAVGLDPDWEPTDNGRATDTEAARFNVVASKECQDCHNADNRMSPTRGADTGEYQGTQGDASHYLGDFASGTWAHFGGNLGGSFVTEPWPSTGWSRFGGTAGASLFVCESCHELEPGKNVTATALLLEAYTEGAAESRNALCEGCHSQNATPTGAPHPMTTMDITKAQAVARGTTTLITTGGAWSPANVNGTFADMAGAPLGNTTYPANDEMNCDSCHQPHNADSNSGTYILETSAAGTEVTGTPDGSMTLYGKTWPNFEYVAAPMDYHLFCNLCHASGS